MGNDSSEVPNVFRVSKGNRVLCMAVFVPSAVAAVGIPFWLLTDSSLPFGTWVMAAALCLCFGALMIFALAAVHRRRIEVFHDRIRYVGTLHRCRELRLEDIEGFRIRDANSVCFLVVIPKDKAAKTLTLGTAFERRAELSQWFQANVRNLDAEDFQAELKEVLSDQHLGGSEEQRMATLKTVRKYVGALDGAAIAATFWGWLYPRPYAYAMAALALLPLVAAALVQWFPHAIQFDGKNKSARPVVAYSFFGPATVLAFRAFMDWHILEWTNVWMPVVSIAVAMTFWIAFSAAYVRRKMGMLVSTVIFGLVYGYGLVVHLNCYYDLSKPAVYQTTVQSRHIESGQYVCYNLKVKPWLERDEEKEVEVSRQVYERHEVGSKATILVSRGSLSIKWFRIR
ncbi:MAG: hypothetical protein HZC54_25490 [Verrucomicrobia bacterium]|nr:hypothetical protein [Verrucomicrobiota bacterium]